MFVKRRQDALLTIKRLPYFGHQNYGSDTIDFEWPIRDDIMAMPYEKPIRIVAIKWNRTDVKKNRIGAIQVILENGCASPIFKADK